MELFVREVLILLTVELSRVVACKLFLVHREGLVVVPALFLLLPLITLYGQFANQFFSFFL
jgi:hypothetical protein